MRIISLFLLAAALLAAGCVYRQDIQQGNFIAPSDVARIKPGMTRSQVRYLLGTPQLADPFQADRWEYVYYLDRSNGKDEHGEIVVYFDANGGVTRVDTEAQAKGLSVSSASDSEPRPAGG
ncbi:MAG: outer membrane protein assembly factor BamE [Gammaproteobacteria bacterium]|jgi:outer membrane protein assembly factor BamE